MLKWIGPESERIRVAFTKVFGANPQPFGNAALRIGGFSDGKDGVQWNVAYDPDDARLWVGVNLEGMQYDDWPIARVIERELKEPSLVELVRNDPALADVHLLWRRDYWQANSRPEIEEKIIVRMPLGALDDEAWRASLVAAQACLDKRRKYRGRGRQTVTLPNGTQVEGEVSPHLTFEYFSPAPTPYEDFFREAKGRMQNLHKWLKDRAARPITF